MLRMKRIDELPREEDGFRILIDESWPKDLSKEEARVDLWLNEIISPTKNHAEWLEDTSIHFDEVEAKYRDELRKKRLIKIIRDTEKEIGTVTFLYSTIHSIRRLQF